MTEGPIERGHAALAACDWSLARACFEEALASAETPGGLDGLGQALYWLGDYPRALHLRERAYAGYRESGEVIAAGSVAVQLAGLHLWIHGDLAVCEGWTGHARRLLEDVEECPEQGWLELLLASSAVDPAVQARHGQAAVEMGRRLGDLCLEYDALGHVGLSLVRRGRVTEGMRLIDESAAAVSSGIVDDPWPAGEIYCSLFGACEVALDVRRADAWLGAIDAFVARTGELPVSAICRMHHGGLLTAAGRWDEAEVELAEAIDLYDRSWRGSRGGPVLRLADLRVKQGRLEEARRLLEDYEATTAAAVPAARLYLAVGEAALAVRTLERHLARRGRGLASAPVLWLLVEAALADGRRDEAAGIANELAALADATEQVTVGGLAVHAQARVEAAAGGRGAIELLEQASAVFAEAELPYELARARYDLAVALAGDEPMLARAEARAALTGFERLGAGPDVDAARALLRSLERTSAFPGGRTRLTPRETEVLGLVAEGRSNAEIASALFISLRTAEDHVSNILAKLGLHNRTEAAAYVLRLTR
ncbi:helix-turn-helix transcriptional regulator [Nitriliruptor alkaliphilus]|uniref:helix-turn-helix transcriptional regulator n=1 Tax=Nitriliruptor alkaliphilus TaxID=427918 RepID=UPI000B0E3EE2|nr:helix-turn-helix transcriptional regulator [Nitriliruptor alkaliphilus]